MCFAPQRRALFRHLNLQKWSEPLVFLTFWLRNVLRATTACTFSTSEPPKVVRTPRVFNILTSTCFSPQRRALFRHLNLQKWSEPLVFLTFWLRNVLRATTACTFSTSEPPKVVRTPRVFNILTSTCFAPQRRALFRHLNLQKWSEPLVFLTFWLQRASRHNGVHFFDIWTSKSGPTLVCFVHFHFEMCFEPQRRALFRHLNFQNCSEPLSF